MCIQKAVLGYFLMVVYKDVILFLTPTTSFSSDFLLEVTVNDNKVKVFVFLFYLLFPKCIHRAKFLVRFEKRLSL